METMRQEWQAWIAIGESLKELGYEGWDDPKLKKFHAQIVLWGELLAALRVEQDDTIRTDALNNAAKQLSRV